MQVKTKFNYVETMSILLKSGIIKFTPFTIPKDNASTRNTILFMLINT